MKIKNDFFTLQFKKAYESKWDKTQEQFAEAMRSLDSDNSVNNKVNNRYVSDWLNGKSVPSPHNQKLICEVLHLPEEYFKPYTKANRYTYDIGYQNDIAKKLNNRALEIGLDPDFFYAIRNCTPFDEIFPVYRPHELVRKPLGDKRSLSQYLGMDEDDFEIRRMSLAEACETDEGCDLFQIKKEGKTYTLSEADLRYLKEVQDKVFDYVRFLFYERDLEMKKEDETVKRIPIPKMYREEVFNGTVTKCYGDITPEEKEYIKKLREIDRFRKYVFEEDPGNG